MQIVEARVASVAGLPVRRVLPSRARRKVGPFVFLDEMGPTEFAPGEGIDVPPHPHIGLSTLTYLLEGGIDHRDSTGAFQPIRPGAVNWMTAGRGVTHSERADPADRARGGAMQGVQAWVALPPESEEIEPSFEHHPAESLPMERVGAVKISLLAGEAFGLTSPVRVHSPLFYVDARWESEGGLELDPALGERAVYPLDGSVEVGGERIERGQLATAADDGEELTVVGAAGARVLLLGGPRREAPVFMHWNYVASTEERIADAKRRWASGGFPLVVGDDAPGAVDPLAP
ncbi:MAG: pirin family protein [Planctomycetota bacterium]